MIGVMARLPEPGRVKTRLIPAVGPEGACRVHERLLGHTLAVVRDCGLPARLFVTGNGSLPADLAEAWTGGVFPQDSGGLDRRMQAALMRMHDEAECVVLVGSDCPVLTPGYLHQALAALDDHDFVLGPAEDGGYVLIGSRQPSFWSGSTMLAEVEMGTSRAMAQTQAVLEQAGSLALLPRLWDLDEPRDLDRACRELRGWRGLSAPA